MLCDYGLDDAIATCHVFENLKKFSRIDILAVGGNVPPAVSLRNARTLAARFDLGRKVTVVDTCGVKQNWEELYHIHGADGMGGVLAPADSAAVPADGGVRCVKFRDWIRDYEGCDVLLSLGPMTVTRKVLKKALPGKFIFMGGSIAAETNYRGYEFNEGVDPKAFAACVKIPHKAVTLDTGSRGLDIDRDEITGTSLKDDLTGKYRELCRSRGEIPCYVWDDIAVRYMLRPADFDERICTDANGNVINRLIYKGAGK